MSESKSQSKITSDTDSDDDDLLLSQCPLKKTKSSSKKKDSKMLLNVDNFLKESQQRYNQECMMKEKRKEHEKRKNIELGSSEFSDVEKDDQLKKEKKKVKDEKTKTEKDVEKGQKIYMEKIDALIKDGGKSNIMKRKRQLKNAYHGIATKEYGDDGLSKHCFDSNDNGSDDSAEIEAAMENLPGYSSKVGVRNVLGHRSTEIRGNKKINQLWETFSSEDVAINEVKKIIAVYKKQKDSKSEKQFQCFLMPLLNAVDKFLLPQFIQAKTLVRLARRYKEEDIYPPYEILGWLFRVAISNNNLSIIFCEGASGTLISLIAERQRLHIDCNTDDFLSGYSSLFNLMMGFRLKCGYFFPRVNSTDVKKINETKVNISNDEKVSWTVIKQYLKLWTALCKYNCMRWENSDVESDGRSFSQVSADCFEMLVFASIDECFYSGNGLLEILQDLITSILAFVKGELKRSQHQSDNESSEDIICTFQNWIEKTSHQIIYRCRDTITLVEEVGTNHGDENGWLGMSLLTNNIPIFQEDFSMDLLCVSMKAKLSELALYRCLYDSALPQSHLKNISEDSKEFETLSSWDSKINDSKPKMTETSLSSHIELAWKCLALAQIGTSLDNVTSDIRSDCPRFYSTIVLAHACAEIGNSLFILVLQQLERSSEETAEIEKKEWIEETDFPMIQLQNMKEVLSILEENCKLLRKKIASVFHNDHLRRLKELIVCLTSTYKQWQSELNELCGLRQGQMNHQITIEDCFKRKNEVQ